MSTVDAVTFIPATANFEQLAGLGAVNGQTTSEFSTWFNKEVHILNEQINSSDLELRKFAAGETNNIHHLMISMEKAKLSFQLVTQVRNKALEAYQDLMRMQI